MAEDDKGPWWEHTEDEGSSDTPTVDEPATVDAPGTVDESPRTMEAPPTMESPPTMEAPPTFENAGHDFISHTPATVAIDPNAMGGGHGGFISTPPTVKMPAVGGAAPYGGMGQPYGGFPSSGTDFAQTPSPMGGFQTGGGMQPGFGSGLPVMPGYMLGHMHMPGAMPGMEPLPPTAHYQQLQLSEFGPGAPYAVGRQNLNLLYDVPVPITVVLGRSVMRIQEVLSLQPGSVVTLDRNDGEPVDLLIKDKLIAQGEVVVIDGNYGIKITRIVDAERRLEAGTGVIPRMG